ncbi:unnamed protein product [Boreogadus saida]
MTRSSGDNGRLCCRRNPQCQLQPNLHVCQNPCIHHGFSATVMEEVPLELASLWAWRLRERYTDRAQGVQLAGLWNGSTWAGRGMDLEVLHLQSPVGLLSPSLYQFTWFGHWV